MFFEKAQYNALFALTPNNFEYNRGNIDKKKRKRFQ